ncbi:MAG: ATP cone domain-containing protein [Patescibacteria group bacterium]|nr:ATP cone domain-containing protein [Patescibacteria group bacterium]
MDNLNDFLEKSDTEFVTIEMIQDQIERELMESGHFEVMKHFIIYRNERSKLRVKEKEKVEKKLENNTFKIRKTTGEKENFDIEKIKKTYKIVSYGLARKCRFEEITDSLRKYIVE